MCVHNARIRNLLVGALLPLICASGFQVRAGGSALNTVVIVNQNSTNSCELGNYYCERRQVPPENVLRINWAGGNISWGSTDFQTSLLSPLLDMLTARQLTNQIDYVVLSMDIPFQTLNGAKVNSTTSALFYGLMDDSGPDWMDVTNSYSASEQIFRQATPASAPGYSFLATMLTAGSLAQAELLVDQGVASDSTFPAQPVILAKSSDPVRNVRYHAFDNAIFNTILRGNYAVLRTNSDSPSGQSGLLGYQTGLASFSISSNTFVPGAMADNLTSFGGIIFGPNSQTTLLAFINAGAAGSYGTVTEPSGNPQKFPDPQNYFYQARGFSLAECYYQSLYAPYQGLIVGEPLAAPFAQTAAGGWGGVASNAVLSGTAQLGVAFSALDGNHPLQQIDLFADGKYLQTLTNAAPQAGNVLTVALNGYPITYTVPTNATLSTVAAGLAAQLNAPATTNLTQVVAFVHGDRIELHSPASNCLAAPFYFTDCGATNGSGRYYRTAFLPGAVSAQLSSMSRGSDGAFHVGVTAPAGVAYVVQATTNFVSWVSIFTNQAGGAADFIDPQTTNSTRRFYRTSVVAPALPGVSVLNGTNASGALIRVDGAAQPYIILESANQTQWTPIFTNLLVGSIQAAAGSSPGGAAGLSTFVSASRSTFLNSSANGLRTFCLGGSLAVGTWLQLSVTKTNGVGLSLSVTNQSSSAALFDLAQQLAAAVNSSPDLQGNDGLVMEDLCAGAFGTASFNLRALGLGWNAAAIGVQVTGSASVFINPPAQMHLDANLSDLQPRNHLYVTAGASQLALTFSLDTTKLADGFHELAAVSYEGSSVRTQTRITLPLQIQNSSLSATLTLLDLAGTAPVQGTYHIQVAANTNSVSAISLFSTGGLLTTLTNQSTATFTVDGSALGAGLHPFYALVQTTGGAQYRTQTQWARLVNPQ
jgi:uncharacterized protein (TIGR03790 family)